jgi:hypothetical protein
MLIEVSGTIVQVMSQRRLTARASISTRSELGIKRNTSGRRRWDPRVFEAAHGGRGGYPRCLHVIHRRGERFSSIWLITIDPMRSFSKSDETIKLMIYLDFGAGGDCLTGAILVSSEGGRQLRRFENESIRDWDIWSGNVVKAQDDDSFLLASDIGTLLCQVSYHCFSPPSHQVFLASLACLLITIGLISKLGTAVKEFRHKRAVPTVNHCLASKVSLGGRAVTNFWRRPMVRV